MSGLGYVGVAVGLLAVSVIAEVMVARWAARRFAARLRPAWAPIAAEFDLEPSPGPMGVALQYVGQVDGHRAHVIGYQRRFSKMLMGRRPWRVVVIEIKARWRCAPKRKKGVVWSVDSLGYQGSTTLKWHGEALAKDAPEIVPGVAGSAPRGDLEPEEKAVLARRVATGQAWILPDRISLAWTDHAADEGEALAAALADARVLARLASTVPSS